jgi:hypothetical protein
MPPPPSQAAGQRRLSSACAIEASYPLSRGQRGLWYLNQIRPSSSSYHLALAVRIHSPLDLEAWRSSLQYLVDRHPCLRTAISMNGTGEPVNQVLSSRELAFEVVEAHGLDDDSLRSAVSSRYAEPFDLATDPLVRAHLFSRSDSDHVFLLTVHHVVFDGHSLWRLLTELREIYAAKTSGREPALPALRHSYADFVSWQAEMLAGCEGEGHLEYWRRQLDGASPFLHLPTDPAPWRAVRRT